MKAILPFKCSGKGCPSWLSGGTPRCPTCGARYEEGAMVEAGGAAQAPGPEVITEDCILRMARFFSGDGPKGQRINARRAKRWDKDIGAAQRRRLQAANAPANAARRASR